jgi:transposase-like protein
MHTMTERKSKFAKIDVKALLAGYEEFLRGLVRTALQEVLEVEMTDALGAETSERTRIAAGSSSVGNRCRHRRGPNG